MRRLVIAALLGLSTGALAGPLVTERPKPFDARPALDKLDVYRDDVGNLYVVPKPGAFSSFDDTEQSIFYGDRKALFQQRAVGGSLDSSGKYEFDLWAPRVKGLRLAILELVDATHLKLSCRSDKDGQHQLTRLQADEARTALQHATFYPPLWRRQAHLLARDDDGVYYYVDRVQDDYGGKGYRVFVGPKGAMKQLVMTNIVSDSAGEIYITKTGQLKLVAGTTKLYWVKGGKKHELTQLEPGDNVYLIYRDLGIYGQLGTVCEDD